jgi:hypothetical protein
MRAQSAALERAFSPQAQGFWGKVMEQAKRGTADQAFARVHNQAAELLATDPKNPEYNAAYAQVRRVSDAYDKLKAELPVKGEGAMAGFQQAVYDAVPSVKPMIEMGAQELAVWGAIGLLGMIFPVAGGMGAYAKLGQTVARGGVGAARAARALQAGKTAFRIGGLASGAARYGAEAGILIRGMKDEFEQSHVKTIVDAGGSMDYAVSSGKLGGLLYSLSEGIVSPAQLLSLTPAGRVMAPVGRVLSTITTKTWKKVAAKVGAAYFASWLGENSEELVQSGIQGLTAYNAANALKNPEMAREVALTISDELGKHGHIDGINEIKSKWDAF